MITPLRKRTLQGELYRRDAKIESLLADLSSLSRDELLERAKLSRRSDPAYIPSECLIFFVRESRADNNDDWFERLYKILMERVLRSLPKAESPDGRTESYSRGQIRERVFGRVQELLAADRTSYSERLDYFEIRFDGALASLRRDVQEQVWRHENRSVPLDMDDETGEPSLEVERAAAEHINPFDSSHMEDGIFRLRLEAAIESLPVEQRSVIEMIRQEIPIDSKEPGVMTIASVLGRSEKTIRNYRDKAIASLRAALSDGDTS